MSVAGSIIKPGSNPFSILPFVNNLSIVYIVNFSETIAMQKTSVPNVQHSFEIRPVTHRGVPVWMVTFSFSEELYNQCRKWGGRYSRTHRGWWWSKEKLNKTELRKKLSGKSFTKEENRKTISKTAEKPGIADLVREKIGEMELWMRQKRYSPNTIKTYVSFVRQFFAARPDLDWNSLKTDDIINYNYQHYISSKKSYSSQNQWINAIKIYLKVHGLDHDGLQNIERPHKSHYLPDVLTPEEVKAIFRLTINLKHRTLLMLIYSCGLRIGEALELKPDDIQSQEGLIYIRGGKGQKDRRVPLSDRILQELRQYYQRYQPSEYLFEGQKGGKYSNSSAAQVLKRAVQKAGISKSVTLHTLRHSYATHLTNNGVNIQYLQEILGHKSPKTTMIYTHLSGKNIRSIRSPLDDMDI